MKKIAILTSNKSHGTNLKAIIHAVENNTLPLNILVVMSDSADAEGLTFAKQHTIPIHVVTKNDNLITLLTKDYPVDYICLAGWKLVIPDEMIDAFPRNILNIHPGLVPDEITGTVVNPDGTKGIWNKGKFMQKAIQNFFDNNATYAGCSLHFLTKEFDFGPVVARRFIPIQKNDTIDSLYDRIKQEENEIYVEALQKLAV